jgi:hypothetical protein
MSTSLPLLGGGEAFASVARATRKAEAATAATETIVMRGRVTLIRPKGSTGSSFWDTGITPFCQKKKNTKPCTTSGGRGCEGRHARCRISFSRTQPSVSMATPLLALSGGHLGTRCGRVGEWSFTFSVAFFNSFETPRPPVAPGVFPSIPPDQLTRWLAHACIVSLHPEQR